MSESKSEVIELPASGGSTVGHIFGILIGIVAGLGLIALIIWLVFKVKGKAKEGANNKLGGSTNITPGGNKTFGR